MDAAANASKQVTDWPIIRTVGVDGLLISFGAALSEPANRAALAFQDAVKRTGWSYIDETSISLVSAYIRFDLLGQNHDQMRTKLKKLIKSRNWFEAPLPSGRTFWRIPTVFGTGLAPQLEEAASVAGLSPDEAIASISQCRVRVQTIGFAPGTPYLGELPEAWNIPRQTTLTEKIPVSALAVAIRQMVLFSVSAPTGWRHVGQTAFQLFRPEAETPFVLRPGDEVQFLPTTPEKLASMSASGPDGGATAEIIR